TQANSFAPDIVKTFSEAGLLPTDDDSVLLALIGLFATALGVAVVPFKVAPAPPGFGGEIANSIRSSSDSPTLDKLAVFGDYIGSAAGKARDATDSNTTALFHGDADIGGFHIWNYLKGGQFTLPASSTDESDAANWLETVFIAGGIDALWKSDRTYIVSADSSNCASDSRGPSKLRYCADPPDGRVHYAY
ncbi:hypothetical protein GP486_008642, partial [Trichoglossum hirsutum]